MIVYENECVGCPTEIGCLGDNCSNKKVPHFYCDLCNDDVEELYLVDNQEVCQACLHSLFTKITFEDINYLKF